MVKEVIYTVAKHGYWRFIGIYRFVRVGVGVRVSSVFDVIGHCPFLFCLFCVSVGVSVRGSVSVGVRVSRGEKFFAPTVCNL